MTVSATQYPRDRFPIPFVPAAVIEGSWSLRLNPAALAWDIAREAYYLRGYTDETFGGRHALYSSAGGVGFGTEWVDRPPGVDGKDTRNHIIAAAMPVTRKIRIGSSYEWVSAGDRPQNKAHFWTHAISLRPGRRVWLSAVWHNANRMRFEGQRTASVMTYAAGTILRQGRLRIGVDWVVTSDEGLNDGTYRVGGRAAVGRGIVLTGDFDREGTVFVGATVYLGKFVVGATNGFHDPGGFTGGTAYVGHIERPDRAPGRR